MKYIYYKLNCPINVGTEEEPVWKENLTGKEIDYTEANLELAKEEAYNGEYTIEDDGQPEPTPAEDDSVWDELDAAYQEGVNSAYDK